jgi:membrane fusion protein, multidrug efflux system
MAIFSGSPPSDFYCNPYLTRLLPEYFYSFYCSKTMFTQKKTYLYILIIAFITGCTANGKEKQHEISHAVYPVTELINQSTNIHFDYVADVQAVQNVEIRARVQGYLEQIYVDEGQEVKKGQPLFRINSEEYQAELSKSRAIIRSAIADARVAEMEVERVKLLVDKGIITKTELELARAKYEAINSKIEEARSAEANALIKLSHTNIKSPFDGVIDRIQFKIGSLINEGTLLTTISDIHAMNVYFNVSEVEYLEYVKSRITDPNEENDVVELILADGSTYAEKGRIETLDGEFETGTGSIAFRARFKNQSKMLKHGSTGKVRLTNQVKDALIVPQKAAVEIQDKNFVYILDKNNKISLKSFIPKTRFSHFYIIESGLKPGDRIIYEGVQSAREGMLVEPKLLPLDSLIKAQTIIL